MSTQTSRVFIARLSGVPVFAPNGDQVGRVRDVVVTLRIGAQPRVLGLVVEVTGRRRIFVPITRVTTIDVGQVITTGVVNLRTFQQRPSETLVLGELLDRKVDLVADETQVTVLDVDIEASRTGDWLISKVYIRKSGGGIRRRGETLVVDWDFVSGFSLNEEGQGAAHLLATFDKLRPADLASEGLTQEKIDNINNLDAIFEDAIDNQLSAVGARDISAQDRILKGNLIYKETLRLCNIGKDLFFKTDPARYNDYIIYDAPKRKAKTAAKKKEKTTKVKKEKL